MNIVSIMLLMVVSVGWMCFVIDHQYYSNASLVLLEKSARDAYEREGEGACERAALENSQVVGRDFQEGTFAVY